MLIQDIPLLLMPACALLNHLGGQSTTIPDPRIVCRVIGIPAAFAAAAYYSGMPIEMAGWCLLIALCGMALWAVPGWASGFCCIPPYHDYRGTDWLSEIVNDTMDENALSKPTPSQLHEWGVVFMTLRGAFMYPMFCALAGLLTPYAAVIGSLCLTQGIVYGNSKTVLIAEWIFGAVIGAALCAILMIR